MTNVQRTAFGSPLAALLIFGAISPHIEILNLDQTWRLSSDRLPQIPFKQR
jgi:hypothetical protein